MCLLREEGSFPVRSFVLHEGVRFPLGVASAGTAILAFLPEDEQEQILSDWAAHAGEFAAGHGGTDSGSDGTKCGTGGGARSGGRKLRPQLRAAISDP